MAQGLARIGLDEHHDDEHHDDDERGLFERYVRGARRRDENHAARLRCLVVQHAAAIGLDVATFAGHSLRAGFATSAKCIGPDEWRHLDERGLDDSYVRASGTTAPWPGGSSRRVRFHAPHLRRRMKRPTAPRWLTSELM